MKNIFPSLGTCMKNPLRNIPGVPKNVPLGEGRSLP